MGESGAAAVLEHKFCPCLQVFARLDVTDVGRPAFSQSARPRPTDGFGAWFWIKTLTLSNIFSIIT